MVNEPVAVLTFGFRIFGASEGNQPRMSMVKGWADSSVGNVVGAHGIFSVVVWFLRC
jgi:hypothetical protein